MGKKTRAQQLRANDQRRTLRSKSRQAVFICEYIQFKYFDLYAEAASFFNALNTMYSTKHDLRKTKEYREWKTVINGETLKTRKLPMPQYLNIENSEFMPPQSPAEAETTSSQRPTEPESTPPQSPTEPEPAMFIKIKESKTDPFRVGHTIVSGGTNTPLCPVLAMKKYLAKIPPQAGPLFVNAVGKPLTKQALTLETRKLLAQAGFNASNYAGHSYRIGAATTAAAAELPSWLIKTLGRWSSNCYERYIQTPSSTLLNVAATLAKI